MTSIQELSALEAASIVGLLCLPIVHWLLGALTGFEYGMLNRLSTQERQRAAVAALVAALLVLGVAWELGAGPLFIIKGILDWYDTSPLMDVIFTFLYGSAVVAIPVGVVGLILQMKARRRR